MTVALWHKGVLIDRVIVDEVPRKGDFLDHRGFMRRVIMVVWPTDRSNEKWVQVHIK